MFQPSILVVDLPIASHFLYCNWGIKAKCPASDCLATIAMYLRHPTFNAQQKMHSQV